MENGTAASWGHAAGAVQRSQLTEAEQRGTAWRAGAGPGVRARGDGVCGLHLFVVQSQMQFVAARGTWGQYLAPNHQPRPVVGVGGLRGSLLAPGELGRCRGSGREELSRAG